jgi:hypothetical protein
MKRNALARVLALPLWTLLLDSSFARASTQAAGRHAQRALTERECRLPFLIGSAGVDGRRSEPSALTRDPVAAAERAKLRR